MFIYEEQWKSHVSWSRTVIKLHQNLGLSSSNSEMLSGSTKDSLSSVFFKVLLYEHFLLYLGLFCALSLLPFLFICTCSQRCCSNKTTGRPHVHGPNLPWNTMFTDLCKNHKHAFRCKEWCKCTKMKLCIVAYTSLNLHHH